MIPYLQLDRIISPTGGIKVLELLLNFITLMLMCYGGSSVKWDKPPGTDLLPIGTPTDWDSLILGCVVVVGFFYFNLVQIISILMGDEPHVLNVVHSSLGFVLFLSCGSVTVDFWTTRSDNNTPLALGAFAIMTSLAYLADCIISVNIVLKK